MIIIIIIIITIVIIIIMIMIIMFFIKHLSLITTLTIQIYLQIYSVKALFTISIKKLFSSSVVL